MKLSAIKIENFRGIDKIEFDFNDLTAIIGANSTGKTSILDAINAFFTTKIIESDYPNNSSNTPKISIKFNEHETDFSFHTLADGWITMEFIDEKLKYRTNVCLSKALYDNISDYKKLEKKDHFVKILEELRLEPKGTIDDLCGMIRNHVKENNEREERIDIADVFIKKFTVIHLNAFKNIGSEDQDSKSSQLSKLIKSYIVDEKGKAADLVQNFELKERFQNLKEGIDNEIAQKYCKGLSSLGNSVSSELKELGLKKTIRFVSDLSHSEPKTMFRGELVDKISNNRIEYEGHGEQRLYVYAIFMAQAKKTNNNSNKQILLIDEPELFQYPQRLSLIFKLLQEISEKYQVIYSTHSPKFLSAEILDGLRVLRWNQDSKIDVMHVDYDKIKSDSQIVKEISDNDLTKHLLLTNTVEFKESLFADIVVLVEGKRDRAFVKSQFEIMYEDPEKYGISFLVCGGKSAINEQILIYKQLGIKTYVVFDMDSRAENSRNAGNAKKDNNAQNLLISSYATGQNSPSVCCGVFDDYAIFEKNLEDWLKEQDIVSTTKIEIMKEQCMEFIDTNEVMVSQLLEKIDFSNDSFLCEICEYIHKKIEDS